MCEIIDGGGGEKKCKKLHTWKQVKRWDIRGEGLSFSQGGTQGKKGKGKPSSSSSSFSHFAGTGCLLVFPPASPICAIFLFANCRNCKQEEKWRVGFPFPPLLDPLPVFAVHPRSLSLSLFSARHSSLWFPPGRVAMPKPGGERGDLGMHSKAQDNH